MVTKHDIKARLGFTSDAQVARLFGISTAAVSLWGDRPIPANRWRQLRYELEPEAFADVQRPASGAEAA